MTAPALSSERLAELAAIAIEAGDIVGGRALVDEALAVHCAEQHAAGRVLEPVEEPVSLRIDDHDYAYDCSKDDPPWA